MSAVFSRSGSTRLVMDSAPAGLPATGYPFTVCAWINMVSVGITFNTVFSYADTGTDNHALRVHIDASEKLTVVATSGGTPSNATLASSLVAGEWCYFVARFISSSNRRISALYKSGRVEHASTFGARAPTSLDTMALGILQDATPDSPADVMIAEFFYTNTDIQAGGTQLNESTLRQLAFNGPFSIPHIANDIMEYRSFRKHPTAGDGEDIYWGRSAKTWTNTNGVTIGPHPPLPVDYRGPRYFRRPTLL